MGAVQKLATVVMVGMVVLATALTVYIAREPERRDEELTEQEEIAIERGTDLYIQYCLQCHGPAGLGSSDVANEEHPRLGPPLNQEGAGIPENPDDPPDTYVPFQSDNPAEEELAEDFITYRIVNGAPSDPRLDKVMPAFGTELNVEEINDLVFMVMNVDWDYVYNQAVQATGETVAQAECDENEGEGEYCDHIEEAPPLYPTAPPAESEVGEGEGDSADDSGEEGGTPAADGEAGVTVEAQDPYAWSTNEITVQPGDTVAVVGSGGLEHDFTVDELGISEALPAGSTDTVMVTIPEDAEPGEYVFYCSVPGHREQGMEGTLVIEG